MSWNRCRLRVLRPWRRFACNWCTRTPGAWVPSPFQLHRSGAFHYGVFVPHITGNGSPSPIESARQKLGEGTGMKQFVLILGLVLATTPAWCAKKITVDELKNTLATMHKESKSDTEVANALKQVELSEELT